MKQTVLIPANTPEKNIKIVHCYGADELRECFTKYLGEGWNLVSHGTVTYQNSGSITHCLIFCR